MYWVIQTIKNLGSKDNKTYYNVSLKFITLEKIKYYNFALSPQSGTQALLYLPLWLRKVQTHHKCPRALVKSGPNQKAYSTFVLYSVIFKVPMINDYSSRLLKDSGTY